VKLRNLFNKRNLSNTDLFRPYVIAEAGVNHEGDMDIARRLIEEAAEAGADAIKFQTYRAETLASRESPAYWDITKEPTLSQYELFGKYDKFWKKEFEELKYFCDIQPIEFLSTPFDSESVEFLDDLMDVFKISSSDITNKPFIELIAERGKPIILSTGGAELAEIHDAVSWIEQYDVPISLLHCVLNYPTDDSSANLLMIRGLQKEFPNKLIGYSDHTMPSDMKNLELAVLLGAEILEKHFSHDKSLPGNDHYHAMDKDDLKIFLKNIERIEVILGSQKVIALPSEACAIKNARRSLVASCDISKGVKMRKEYLTWKRPGHGISPKHIDTVTEKEAKQDIQRDQILQWEMLS